MLENKLLVNIYILIVDKRYDVFIPLDEKVGNVINLIKKSFADIDISLLARDFTLFNLYTGVYYKNNDIIRDTDIQNSAKLMLI